MSAPVRDSIEKGGILKALALIYKPGRGARDHLSTHGRLYMINLALLFVIGRGLFVKREHTRKKF